MSSFCVVDRPTHEIEHAPQAQEGRILASRAVPGRQDYSLGLSPDSAHFSGSARQWRNAG